MPEDGFWVGVAMNKAIVLSNKEQFNAASWVVLKDPEARILCDNRDFDTFLKEKGIEFTTIGDIDIKPSWKDIDAWSCEKSLLSDKELRRFYVDKVDIGNILYPWFSYYLDGFLRSYLLAKFILEKYDLSEIMVFENVYSREIPLSNTNYFLNLSLRYLAEKTSRKVTLLDSKEAGPAKANRSFKEHLRKMTSAAYSLLCSRITKIPSFIFRGNTDHMASLIRDVKGKGYDVFFYDFEFRLKDFLYSLKNGMPYIVGRRLSCKGSCSSFFDSYVKAFDDMIGYLSSIKWFSYKGEDISGILCPEITKAIGAYIGTIAVDSDFYSHVLSKGDIRGVIVSEDQSPYGSFFAAFFKSHDIPVSCISHGYPIMGMPIDIGKQGFCLSDTFIQSEYEKDLYVSWGWDAKNLHVTGKPVYDELALIRRNGLSKGNRVMRILFCGTTLIPFNPLVNMYGGGYYELEGAHTRKCLAGLINAVAPYSDIEVIIKPHYSYDQRLWHDAINEYNGKARVTLVPATSDFLSVASTCYAMFTSCWSTAVIECLMLGMPVVRMDYTCADIRSRLIPEGMCVINSDMGNLDKLISEFHTSFKENNMPGYPMCNGEHYNYIVGKVDGKSASRVLDKIMQNKI